MPIKGNVFRVCEPSEAMLRGLDPKFDSKREKGVLKLAGGLGLFRTFPTDKTPQQLKEEKMPQSMSMAEIYNIPKKAPEKAKSTYAERYYWALLKADRDREEKKKDDVQEVEEDEEMGLKPLEGRFDIEVELCIEKAPGAEFDDTDDEQETTASEASQDKDQDSKIGASSARDTDEPESEEGGFNAADEMRELQAELAAMDAKDEVLRDKAREKETAKRSRAEATAKAEAARAKPKPKPKPKAASSVKEGSSVPSVDDYDDARYSVSQGGTMYFAPDAERLAMSPSLPPPPPPSTYGRRRLKMKPRLPLDLSWGRYRDEQVFTGDKPYNALDYERHEMAAERFRTVDFYAGCKSAMTQLTVEKNQLMENGIHFGRRFRLPPTYWDARLGDLVREELQASPAWKAWRAKNAEP